MVAQKIGCILCLRIDFHSLKRLKLDAYGSRPQLDDFVCTRAKNKLIYKWLHSASSWCHCQDDLCMLVVSKRDESYIIAG